MRFSKLALLGAFILTLGIAGCNENDNPVTPPTAPNAPTGLMATSRSATSIGLKWTAPATGVTPTGYSIKYTPVGGTAQTMDVATTSTTADITGLVEGTIYTITVSAKNSTAVSTASSAVMWSPAKRLTGTFKLFSSTNSTNGSGLELSTGTVLKIAQGEKWDICFDDKGAAGSERSAPGQSLYVDSKYKFPNGNVSKISRIGRVYTAVNSLDEVFNTEALNDVSNPADSLKEQFVELKNYDATKGGVAMAVYTDQSKNFAKVLIKSVGGKLVQGTGSDAFIEVEVSYQSMSDVPYALKNDTRTYPRVMQAYDSKNAQSLGR